MAYLVGEIIIILLLVLALGIWIGRLLRGADAATPPRELMRLRERLAELEQSRRAIADAGVSLRDRLEVLEAHKLDFSQRLQETDSNLAALAEFRSLFQSLNQAHARETSRFDSLQARLSHLEHQLGSGFDAPAQKVWADATDAGASTDQLSARIDELGAKLAEFVEKHSQGLNGADTPAATSEGGAVSEEDAAGSPEAALGPASTEADEPRAAVETEKAVASSSLESAEASETSSCPEQLDGDETSPKQEDSGTRPEPCASTESAAVAARADAEETEPSEEVDAECDGELAETNGHAANDDEPDDSSAGTHLTDRRDNLKRIRGIGRVIERLLNEAGINRFDQIAEWGDEDIARYSECLGEFSPRIERDDWVQQARRLAAAQASAGLTKSRSGSASNYGATKSL